MPTRNVGHQGLKLNKGKFFLRQSQLHFLGHLIDPNKVEAIHKLLPGSVQELKRVLAVVNYLGRLVPALTTVEQPLYEFPKSKNIWTWVIHISQLLRALKGC